MSDSKTIAVFYDQQVQPVETIINGKKKWNNTRASKSVRYEHFYDKDAVIKEKERWSIEIIKIMLKRTKKPVISCSFGIDSIVILYLTRKALKELNRDPSDIDVVWNNTLNEFLEVRNFAKEITDDWNLRLIETKPKKVLKKVIEEHGGVDTSYFARKGDRSLKLGKRPLSEKCCSILKHEPMNRATKEHGWDGIINGLRADESNQRLLASLRDGEFFYSSGTWKAYVARPILWWKENELWEYVESNDIPYNKLYDKNLIQKYPQQWDGEIIENQKVDRKTAILLKEKGFKIFTPRTGCQMCPIPVKYGYLHWMREFYPKVYDVMVHKLKYGSALLKLIPKETIEEIKMITGIDITDDNAHEYMEEIINGKPCIFDEF